ncbi:MAG: serine/threonine protein kinase/tetratricopeptide (TPR) repeat protein [Myxococcota bacterium]|jgi:serine/threonine protein kinase/tetratricopeptide (TPR) repeat protein
MKDDQESISMSEHKDSPGPTTRELPFQLTAFLGRGGFGAVWAVERAGAGQAAVKLLHRVSAKMRQRFVMEARAVARLLHPNIIRIFDFGELSAPLRAGDDVFEAGSSYLMTALGRANLRTFHALSGEEVRRLLLEMLSALAHAHARGVIHRDIKPANILASTSAGPPWLLADFGTAHALDVEWEDDRRWAGVGTPRYMAPEQIRRQLHRQGPWTDLFALGCMAQELALGRPIHEGFDLPQILSAQLTATPIVLAGIDPDYQAWLSRMTAESPLDRFHSAADAARALRQITVLPAQGAGSEPSTETWTGTLSDLDEAPMVFPVSASRTHRPQPAAPMDVPLTWQEPIPTLAPIGLGVGVLHVRDIGVIGRKTEQQQMWRALRLAAHDRCPRVVLLRGPAGIGKSRLARWLAEQAHEQLGADVISVTATGSGNANTAILSAALRCSGLVGAARDQQLQDQLAQLPALPMATRGAIRTCLTDGADPEDGSALLLALLEERSRARPSILVIDDAHYTTAFSLVEALVEGRGAIVVILAVQDEALAAGPPLPLAVLSRREAVTMLRLSPLSIEAQQSLLRAKVGLEEHEALGLADRTAGNPRYAENLLQAWLAEGRLELGPAGSRIRDLGRETSALPAFAAAWRDRIERVLAALPPHQRHHIERAAVLGVTVGLAEWTHACAPAPLPETLRQHMVSALVWREEDPERVRFVHAQFREALLDRARLGGRLAGHHRAAAAAIEEAGQHAAYRIAHHLLGAGAVDEALKRMPEVTQSQPSWHHGEVLLEGIQYALESADTPEDDVRWGEVGFYRVRFLIIAHRRAEAQALLKRLEADAVLHGWSSLEPQLLLLRARVARRLNLPEEAISANERLRALYLRRGEPAKVADCEASIGRILLEEGRREEALKVLEQARARVGLNGDKLLESLTIAYTRLKRFDEAEEVMSRWEALTETAGNVARLGYVKLERAHMLKWRGDLSGALALFEEAERLLIEAGLTSFSLFARLNQGIVLAHQGDVQRAHRLVTDIINSLPPQMHQSTRSVIYCIRLVTDAALQDWVQWHEDIAYLVQLPEVPDADLAQILESAGHWATQHGRPGEAARVLAVAGEIWRANQYPEHASRVEATLQQLTRPGGHQQQ